MRTLLHLRCGISRALLALLATAMVATGASAIDPCAPCTDPALRRVDYHVTMGASSRDLIAQALSRIDREAGKSFLSRCSLDALAVPPRYRCTVSGADTIIAWREAVARLGASGSAMSDSVGSLGIATLGALDRALRHPGQVITRLRGRLQKTAQGVQLSGCEPSVVVSGAGADSLATESGVDVWVQGYCRAPDTLDWLGGHRVGSDRVDLFVMGNCPFAHRLEAQMVKDMAKLATDKTPEIAVHYLLHWEDDGLERRIGSAHGEAERREDVVQILIRDLYPKAFWRYLDLRSKAGAPWEFLAKRAGLAWGDIGTIQRRVSAGVDDILMTEHTFNTANFPRVGASPTVFWRGIEVASITEVPGFSAPVNENEKCEGAGAEETPTRW